MSQSADMPTLFMFTFLEKHLDLAIQGLGFDLQSLVQISEIFLMPVVCYSPVLLQSKDGDCRLSYVCSRFVTCNVCYGCCQLLQYIADSGGVLGLWFGFAIMTFIEFFEFFVDFLVLTVHKIYNR